MTGSEMVWPGRPCPLGATPDGDGTNFSLFCEIARRVALCLFDEHGNQTAVDLPEVTAHCGHGYRPGIRPGQRFGYRVHGERRLEAGAELALEAHPMATFRRIGKTGS